MPTVVEARDPEQEIRWRAWREKGRRADRLAEKRMKVLLTIIGLIVLALILYNTLRARVAPISDDVQNKVGSDHFNSYSMAIFRKDPGIVSSAPSTESALTLVTCYPFRFLGAAPERFIVWAHKY